MKRMLVLNVVVVLFTTATLVADDNCCGYNSPGNPYQCYESGNCTWWAWYKRPDLPGWGNASVWLNEAVEDGIPTGTHPIVGSIACFPEMAGGLGHVAYVESVNPDNSFYVSEMGYQTWDCLHYNTCAAGSAEGFIYGGPAGSGPTYTTSWHSQSITPDEPYYPGDEVQCQVKFRNTGTATWSKTPGPNYVELASCNEYEEIGDSFFNYPYDPSLGWLNEYVPCTFNEASVPPDGIATFNFTGRIRYDAPPGPQRVYFGPVYDGQVMEGWGEMHYPVEVIDPPPPPTSNNTPDIIRMREVNGEWTFRVATSDNEGNTFNKQ